MIDPVGPDYRYLGPKCCADMERDLDGTCANCGDHQPPAKPFVRPAVENLYRGPCPICEGADPKCDWADRGKRFADWMASIGLRIEEGDMGETYEVERVFVDGRMVETPILNRGRKVERDEPAPFRRYSIPAKARPGEVPCPYCVKRPIGAKGLRDHCRAVHPDKPEAR